MQIKQCIASILNKENGDQVDLTADQMMQLLQRTGSNEFIIGVAGRNIYVTPLRAGYEATDLPWLNACELAHVCIKGNQAEMSSLTDIKKALSRLPRVPAATAGTLAIENAVNRIMGNRVFEANEPPWPKNDPAFWEQWSRYFSQGHHPTLGAWLKIAIDRRKETIDAA